MAHEIYGDPVTIPAVAQPLHTLLGIPDQAFGSCGIRAETAAQQQQGRIYIGKDANVTAAGAHAVGFIDPGEAAAIPPMLGNCHLSQVYLVGTAGDTAYVWGVTY
jgi:hypothetical protein